MTRFWMTWLTVWCWAVAAFGLVLAGAGLEASDGLARATLRVVGGREIAFDPPLRFAVGLMGCVTLGWGLTLLPAVRAAAELGARGRPVWRALAAGVTVWFVLDSVISVVTGFWLNAVSNTLFTGAFLLPLLQGGQFAAQPSGGRVAA